MPILISQFITQMGPNRFLLIATILLSQFLSFYWQNLANFFLKNIYAGRKRSTRRYNYKAYRFIRNRLIRKKRKLQSFAKFSDDQTFSPQSFYLLIYKSPTGLSVILFDIFPIWCVGEMFGRSVGWWSYGGNVRSLI